MTNDTPPPVAPKEGFYAMLRNGEVVGPLCPYKKQPYLFTARLPHMSWTAEGVSDWDDSDFDIIATISPEVMMMAAKITSPFTSETEAMLFRKQAEENARLEALIPLADAVLDHADAHCRWFDISTAPKLDRVFVSGIQPAHKTVALYRWVHEDCTDPNGKPIEYPDADMWRPLPPSNPPLPAVFTELGAALEKIKEGR
jgi:hypothetical protein